MCDSRMLPLAPLQVAPDVLTFLTDWIQRHFGITYTEQQGPILAARIDGLCRSLNVEPSQLVGRLMAGDTQTVARLADAASTNHTYFMREHEVLEVFRERAFPTLAVRARHEEVRIWSAAASSGDEAYSLAMMIRESLPDADASRVHILGTDISERQVRAAEEGVYPTHQLGDLDRTRLARWFRPLGLGQWQVSSQLRGMCTFRRLNLTASPWPFEKQFDVIFLRNVLYYFEPAVREQVVERCYDATRPGGWLVTSLTEPMLETRSRWIPAGRAHYLRPND